MFSESVVGMDMLDFLQEFFEGGRGEQARLGGCPRPGKRRRAPEGGPGAWARLMHQEEFREGEWAGLWAGEFRLGLGPEGRSRGHLGAGLPATPKRMHMPVHDSPNPHPLLRSPPGARRQRLLRQRRVVRGEGAHR